MLLFNMIVGDNMIFLYILLVAIVIIGLISVFYLVTVSILKKPLFRIEEAEKLINEVLQKKLDLIIKANRILKNSTDLDINMFDEIEELKINKAPNVKIDRKLSTSFRTIIQIKNDYSSLEENREMNEVLKEIKSVDEKLEAAKNFYNQYAKQLVEIKTNFFRKLISKIIKIKDFQLYNIKKTNDEIVNIDSL